MVVLHASNTHTPQDSAATDDPLRTLQHAIDHAAHLLPAQGPITVFIHHNTLHAFEDNPFDQAVEQAARVFGCQPYLTEDRYRAALGTGRIRFDDLQSVVEDELGITAVEPVAGLTTRMDLRLAMLQYPLRTAPAAEILWCIAQTDALERVSPDTSAAARGKLIAETRRWVMRDLRTRAGARANGNGRNGRPAWLKDLFRQFDESRIESWDERTWEAFTLEILWQVCRAGVRDVPHSSPPPPRPLRHRDLLLQEVGADPDLDVNPLLIRFCAAFVDQGVAHWSLPDRDKGFFQCFASLYRKPGGSPEGWMHGLTEELARLQDSNTPALESVYESLVDFGVPDREWEAFLGETLLALRGWGGIIREVETRGDRVAHPIPSGSLTDFLAVRLLLDRFAIASAARESIAWNRPLAELRPELLRRLPPVARPGEEQRAFQLFQLAQVLGWSPSHLSRLSAADWSALLGDVEGFGELERRRVFHLVYEMRFREQTLDAIALHANQPPSRMPRFQAVTCLDEREESFRRHLEEVAPDCQTFGAAGFFGVAMYYRGAAEAHYVPLCPIVIRPRHYVEERPEEPLEDEHRRLRKTRRAFGKVSHKIHVGSRGVVAGAALAAGLGVLAAVPLVCRTLFPRLAAVFRRRILRLIQTVPPTHLHLERIDPEPGPHVSGLGYSVQEMTDIAERQLRDIGLTTNFARLVLVLGHGSNSMNNPHSSAYDCGACGGSPGAPNGRALAAIFNDPRVREGLLKRGITIPAATVFVGGLHNTCNDTVSLFDADTVPVSHQGELDAVRRDLEHACGRNAHERCRRFMSAPTTLSFEEARRHVEGRSEDLGQTRPELGHATNAVCFVGRRSRTRGLFLDRRAFLTSYDPTEDDAESTILARILAAAVPVCAGINLEYYFSRVDSPGYGCGTKLPHNITSLVGVMDGAASDLRTGLPWQMVEIHEPVRLLFVVETTPEAMLKIMARNEAIGRLVRNGWVQMSVLDPHSQRIHLFRDGRFTAYRPRASQLPSAASSADWYRGWRDHLEFAEIGEPGTG